MNDQYNWNLKDIFASKKEFEVCKKSLNEVLERIKEFQGKLCESSQNIYACYQLYEEGLEKLEKLYAYGMLQYNLDMANQESIKLFKEVENIDANFEIATSFMIPEITNMEEEILQKMIQENKNLQRYKRVLEKIMETKKHILSQSEESLLSNFSEVFAVSKHAYDTLTNAEFKFGELIDENGKKVELTDGTYGKFLKSKDRNVRRQAYDLMHDKYSEFMNTITELYLARVKQYTITSKLRNYQSSLENAVLQDEASIAVYEKLVESVHQNLAMNHKFMGLKKKMLKLDEMYMYDIYVNPFEAEDEKISFEEAKKEVLNALAILGEEYTSQLKEAFENRWIDVYEKPNKCTGAYNMGVYGVHPYVLLNFVGSKSNVSDIAHELGHSMHSYYSDANQNIMDSNYTFMIAEVASTVNEILLASYRIDKEEDKNKKAGLLYELIELIKATLFFQTMFAEFEKTVHEKLEKYEVLSGEDLCNIYYDLAKKYFGDSVMVNEKTKYNWMRIPHFYRCFYVYKYATGISSAIAIASRILKKEEGFVDQYIEMLKQGCSKKSIELLKMVDIDLESNKPYQDALKFYQDKIEELEKLLT